jgi:hypothetical protein
LRERAHGSVFVPFLLLLFLLLLFLLRVLFALDFTEAAEVLVAGFQSQLRIRIRIRIRNLFACD